MQYCKSICNNVKFLNSPSQECEWIVHPNDKAVKVSANGKGSAVSLAQFENYLHEHGRCGGNHSSPASASSSAAAPLRRRPRRKNWSTTEQGENEMKSFDEWTQKIQEQEAELERLKKQREQSCKHSQRSEKDIMSDLTSQWKKMQLANTQYEYDNAQQQAERFTQEYKDAFGRSPPSEIQTTSENEEEARRGRRGGRRSTTGKKKGTYKRRKGTRGRKRGTKGKMGMRRSYSTKPSGSTATGVVPLNAQAEEGGEMRRKKRSSPRHTQTEQMEAEQPRRGRKKKGGRGRKRTTKGKRKTRGKTPRRGKNGRFIRG
jgi:hypothetical protein